MAKLVIARPRQYADMLRRYRITVDGELAARIATGQSVEIDLPPGGHRIVATIDWARSNPVEIDAEASGKHRLEVGSNVAGWRLLLGILYATIWRDRYLYLKRG